MIPSVRSCAARFHQPLIRFVGKRQWPSKTPHPHPAAPAEAREQFADFLKKQLGRQSNFTTRIYTNGNTAAYSKFWDAPAKFWKPQVRELDDQEMESVMTGGASSYSH